MTKRKYKNTSYLISIVAHVLLTLLLMAVKFTIDHEPQEYVTVGFGSFGELSSSGVIPVVKEVKTENNVVKKEEKKPEEKKVDVPVVKNLDEDNISVPPKEQKEEQPKQVIQKDDAAGTKDKGRENAGEGIGKFGVDIDWGGKGTRKIYSYNIPPYPDGVAKEIDVKLRFTILADGTVGRIFPLIKADTRLETAAINSLRQWRFEPIPANQAQGQQTVIIIFPFRLK